MIGFRLSVLGVLILPVCLLAQRGVTPGHRSYRVCEAPPVNGCATWSFNGADGQGQWEDGSTATLKLTTLAPKSISVTAQFTSGKRSGISVLYSGWRGPEGSFAGIGRWPAGFKPFRAHEEPTSDADISFLRGVLQQQPAQSVESGRGKAANPRSAPPSAAESPRYPELKSFMWTPEIDGNLPVVITLDTALRMPKPSSCGASSVYSAEEATAMARMLHDAKEWNRALCWTEIAATKGSAIGQGLLGRMYLFGVGGLKEDYARALQLSVADADRGYSEGFASLAYMFVSGKGVPLDEKVGTYLGREGDWARDSSYAPQEVEAIVARWGSPTTRAWWKQHVPRGGGK